MRQGNRHCAADIRNTRARRRTRKRRNNPLQGVGRLLTLFVLTLVLAVGIMLSGAALLGWWPSQEIPRQENSISTSLSTPMQTPEPLTVDVTGINSPYAFLMCRDGTELGEESADASIYPASMTKIMTVLLGVENIPDIVIPVSQEAGKEFFSTLTGPVAISDMESLGALQYHISPSQTWDTTNPGTSWIMDMWSSGVSQESDLFGNQSFLGSGTRIYLKLFSENIPFNDDQEFTLPAGEYRVKQYDAIINKADIVPYTVEAGRETKDLTYPSGSWYMKVDDGGFAEAGPLTGGSMTVAVDGPDTYTFTFDFVDDRGNAITGTAKGTVTKASCNFFPEEPGEDVEPDPDPDPDPDPGFGQ